MDLMDYWQYTDIITKALFFALFALSVASWVTGILRLYYSRQLAKTVAADLAQQLQKQVPPSLQASAEERRLMTEQTLLQLIGRYRHRSEQGLPLLGTTAAIAPFIGLFGTVWGIFHALRSIGMSGQAGLAQVAGPVGEALIMTGLGLAVAIPAVIFYNIIARMNRRTLFLANDIAHGLLGASMRPAVTTDKTNTNV
ncbi:MULTISPECIES: MotA/TolQ/ExbB proton channel family protein [Psychrobacter]|jgi:biopolymer transport protein ExbB|uniref:Biopolymer transport protein ExbB n=1 Tax=Psychrobacter glaciei TaxID=619771 RepID=A0ABQ3GTH1_9GAMM|nr:MULTISPECIES: MotA/TolQ/ExbB proton channel family protein [Psychrobacter]GHD34132.1 biopolymer transporter ExbB [Psychrobacter glaciei]